MYIPNGFDGNTLDKYPKLKEFYMRIGKPHFMEIDVPNDYAKIIAKCEWDNPAETIKAKAALAMIWKLLDDLDEDIDKVTVLEYSGGGLSVALAELCNSLKIKCVLVLMETTSKSIIEKLTFLNARIELTKKEEGFWGVIERAKVLKLENPNWKFLFQHENAANYNFHNQVTAKEILDSHVESIDAWVASIGTGATLAGVYNGIKVKFPSIQLHTNMPLEMPYGTNEAPNSLPKFAGSGGLGCGRKQLFVEQIERNIFMNHCVPFDEAKLCMIDFYRKNKIFIGSSSAANLLTSLKIAKELGKGKTILTVFPCNGLVEDKNEIISKLN